MSESLMYVHYASCSASVSFQRHMRRIKNNSTAGILVQCNCFVCVLLM